MTDDLRLAGTVLLHLSTVAAVAFVVVYHLTADWRRERLGPHVMAFMGVIAAVLLLSSIRQFVSGDAIWFLALRTAVFAGVPVVLYWRLGILIKAQLDMRTARKEGRSKNESNAGPLVPQGSPVPDPADRGPHHGVGGEGLDG